ncbi:MAG: gliding motility lipoprotein GldH [Bacteroidales bacterium]|nr:gliding motility lipoprotein GldH [Bacteroidales bacterium]
MGNKDISVPLLSRTFINFEENFKKMNRLAKNGYIAFLLIGVLFLLNACGSSVIYEENTTFENDVWKRFNKLSFEYNATAKSEPCDIFLTLELTDDFNLKALPVHFTMATPSGEIRNLEHTIEIKNNSNQMKGKKQGGVWKLKSRVYNGFTYRNEGQGKITVENLNYKYQTEGVHSVGILIEKSGGLMLP